MKEKRMQIRLKQDLADEIDKTIVDIKAKGYQPKINVSEFMRQSAEKWIETYEDIELGKTNVMLPTEDLYMAGYGELTEGLIKLAGEVKSEEVKKILLYLDNRLSYEMPKIQEREKALRDKILKELEGGEK